MPPSKKQKTGKKSSKPTREDDSSSESEDVTGGRDVDKIPPFEYVCIRRPYWDWEAEQREAKRRGLVEKPEDKAASADVDAGQNAREGNKDEDEDEENEDEELSPWARYQNEEDAKGIMLQPAAEHKDWKWTIMWEGWKKYCDFRETVTFCDPDYFGMHIYSHWKGYGAKEAADSLMLEFDRALRTQTDENWRFRAWAIVSAIGRWLNDATEGGMDMISIDDGEGACEINSLIGRALLTILAAIEYMGELNPDSKFVDLPIVISSFLMWCHGLEDYGIEGAAIFWRPHVVEYFYKAGLDPSKGVSGTAGLLEKHKDERIQYLSEDEEEDFTKQSEKDPWAWGKTFRKYERRHCPVRSGNHYDIRTFTRKERAASAFDKKDPFRHIPVKDIKAGNIGFA